MTVTLNELTLLCVKHDVSVEFWRDSEPIDGKKERFLIIRLGEELVISFNDEPGNPTVKSVLLGSEGKNSSVPADDLLEGVKLFSKTPDSRKVLQRTPVNQRKAQSLLIFGTVTEVVTPTSIYEGYPTEWIQDDIQYVVEYPYKYEGNDEQLFQKILVTVEGDVNSTIYEVGDAMTFAGGVYRPGVGVLVEQPQVDREQKLQRQIQLEFAKSIIQSVKVPVRE